MIVYVSGSLASYSIAIMDNMFWWAEKNDQNEMYKLILCVVIMYVVVWPMSSLKNLDFMRFNSYVCIICEIIICLTVIIYFGNYKEARKPAVPFNFTF